MMITLVCACFLERLQRPSGGGGVVERGVGGGVAGEQGGGLLVCACVPQSVQHWGGGRRVVKRGVTGSVPGSVGIIRVRVYAVSVLDERLLSWRSLARRACDAGCVAQQAALLR
jgi:hypothetical protein